MRIFGSEASAIASATCRCSPCESDADELVELVRDGDTAGRLTRALADLRVARREDHGPQVPALDADDREVDAVLDREAEEQPRLLIRAREAELARGAAPVACVTSSPKSSTDPDDAGMSPR